MMTVAFNYDERSINYDDCSINYDDCSFLSAVHLGK